MTKPIRYDETQITHSRAAGGDARFRIIFDAVNEGIFISDPATGRFTEVNEPGCRMFGYTRAELIGCDIVKLSSGVHPYTQERAIELLQKAASEGPQVFEWQGNSKTGSLFWVEISLRFTEFGKIPAAVAIVRDITERKLSHDKLREAQAALVEAQVLARVGSFTVDLLNNRTTWSDECCRIIGFDPVTSVASFDAYLARIHPDDRPAFTEAYKQSLADRASRVLDQRVVWGDGTVRFVQQRWQNHYGADGRPLRTTGTVQDITERKTAESAITVSGVLHAVIASVAALINSPSLDEGAPKALRMIGEALKVDRCVVVENVDRPGAPPNMVPTYQWNSSGLEPLPPPFVAEMVKHPDVLSWLSPLSENKPVVTTLANANATVKNILRALKSTSILLIPILVAGRNWGHIGLNDGTPNRKWSAAEVETLLALATLFGVTIERGRQLQILADADAIIRHSPAILYRLSAEPGMPMTYVSSNVARLGYDQAKLLADPTFYRTLIHPDDLAKVTNDQEQVLHGQPPSAAFEIRFLTPDGTYHWFEVRRKEIVGKEGEKKILVGEFIDINDRKLAAEELNNSHALLEMAERVGHAGAWEWDIVHNRSTWSTELYRIYGRDPKEFAPTIAGFFTCVHPDDRSGLKAALDATLTRHQPFDAEFRIVRPDGEVCVVHARAEPTLDEAGNPAKLTGHVQDISELKAAENALKQERDFSATLIDSLPSLFVLIDDNGRYKRWNSNLSTLTGLTDDQLRGHDAYDIIVENDRDMAREKLVGAIAQGNADVEFGVRNAAGDVRTIHWSGQPIVVDGHPHLIAVGTDVTEARKVDALLHAVVLGASEIEVGTNLDASIRKAIDLVSTAIRIDRMGVLENPATPDSPPIYRFAWNAPDVELTIDEHFFDKLTTWTPQMAAWQAPVREGKIVIADFRTATGDAKRMFEFLRIKSVLLIPISVHGKYWGVVGFDSCKQERIWSDAEINILRMLADLIGSAIERERYVKELSDASRIIERSPTILYRLSAAPDMPMIYVSPNVDRLGYDQAKMLAEPTFYRTLIHPDDRARVATDQAQALRGEAPAAVLEVRFLGADGTYRWFENHRTSIAGQDGALTGIEGEIIDINERKLAEAKLRASEQQFRAIFESVSDVIIVREIGSFAVVDANPRAYELYGYTIDEFRRSGLSIIFADKSQSAIDKSARLAQLAASGQPQAFEWLTRAKDGRTISVEVTLQRTTLGGRDFILTTARDITVRKLAEERVAYAARHDFLTELPNRSVFVEELERLIAHTRRGDKSFAILYLDLDHFKDVNDVLGHPAGDLLLQAVAKRLWAAVRQVDTVARFGGDEFAVLNTDIGEPADAVVLADKILKTLGEPFTIQGNEIRSGASIGIAVYEEGAADAEALLSHADVALYRAKAEGRGTYRFFTEAMDTEVRGRVKLTSELRDAINSNQLFLMYQPQVDTETGRIIGFEALARWNHPTRGIVSPIEFIPIAEKSGLIVALGRWVLREACRQMKEWLAAGVAPPLVAVNVSALQFKKSLELENDIVAILAETGLPPERLELEITESVFMEVSRDRDEALQRLRKSGVRIAIDDFGTGYSSLQYLGRLPVNRIKIAQNFMRSLTPGSRNATIVRTAIGMARDLGLDAILEGVETAEQLRMIKSWSGQKVQGFYFSKPLPAGEVPALLRRGKIFPARPDAVKAVAE